MAKSPATVDGVAAVVRLAAGTAQQPNQRIRPAGEASAAAVAGPTLSADPLYALEEHGIDRRLESSSSFHFVRAALVADGAPGIQRVRQDLLDPELGQVKLDREAEV